MAKEKNKSEFIYNITFIQCIRNTYRDRNHQNYGEFEWLLASKNHTSKHVG